jgi:hypothetical protein
MSNTGNHPDASMNKDLEEWIGETKHILKSNHKKRIQNDKQPFGKCSICNDNRAKFFCLKCGQSVCPSCYYTIIGICKRCIPKEIAEKWDGKHPTWKKERDGEWIF